MASLGRRVRSLSLLRQWAIYQSFRKLRSQLTETDLFSSRWCFSVVWADVCARAVEEGRFWWWLQPHVDRKSGGPVQALRKETSLSMRRSQHNNVVKNIRKLQIENQSRFLECLITNLLWNVTPNLILSALIILAWFHLFSFKIFKTVYNNPIFKWAYFYGGGKKW